MLCPYCGSQNPDGTSLCSSCNATLTAGAQPPTPPMAGDASAPYAPNRNAPAGMPYAPGPYAAAGAPPMPAPNEPKAKKGGRGKMVALIVLGAVALVAIIVALVAFVTCNVANANKLSLDNLVKDEPEKTAEFIEGQGLEIVKIRGNAYYTPEEMKDLMSKANKAFEDGSRNAVNKISDDIAEMKPWGVTFFVEEKAANDDGYHDFKNLKLANIQDVYDPSEVVYRTYRVLDNPTPEDIFKIAQEVADIDEITIGSKPTQEGKENYDQLVYYLGYGEGPNTTVYLKVNKLDDVYEIAVYVFNMDEIKGKGIEFVDYAKDGFDQFFQSKDELAKEK